MNITESKFIKKYEEECPSFKLIDIKSIKKTIRLDNIKSVELEKYKIKLEKIKKNLYSYNADFNITSTLPYLDGKFFIQGEPSFDTVELLDPNSNEIILDMCAAPGSKTTHTSNLMKNKGTIVAIENNANRFKKLKFNLEKSKCENIICIQEDATIFESKVKFDKILIDAPCSGNYTVEKDWFEKRTDFDIENKARVQKKLIKNACNLIKKNGILIYSTCSLEKKEDEEIVEYAKKLGFKVLYEKKYWPHIENTIGFYMAKLEYIGS
ncbi:RsmB/NOP family class I SAM-dependent RNA methyltransferase [Candidatus Woesearchaeota archaeon]|jgi:16S rRNA C967 or C1407 C5-methylase (RsmB/RsmF family)|nr:RsmB/NOP family class I SAM-dependent RNA methyltransferase [Candidatus Woesearchaeota archaeon]MBT4387362.1 RsmB/NOP family class I SAM-dependent RNA methyltransferase [Candidatus Woesearchaeota archaeon]MBT4595501.1 RsmB/NOP family class I SAM-dependent RNA methyltransferase [Candidatus Woesearchaeota archaeon]MBT5741126.1 RsmB/NOP family class I SAM-dependent RNA methyltransferase [Candidatus Woesearchaeota archaeon]MBT6505620.1 RsmB/NOP family class I SAM-dependent RNA methyltransferase 